MIAAGDALMEQAQQLGITLMPRRRPHSWTCPQLPGWMIYIATAHGGGPRTDYPVGFEHKNDNRDYGEVRSLAYAVGCL